VLPAGGEGLVR